MISRLLGLSSFLVSLFPQGDNHTGSDAYDEQPKQGRRRIHREIFRVQRERPFTVAIAITRAHLQRPARST
jgi:hypothetical protein